MAGGKRFNDTLMQKLDRLALVLRALDDLFFYIGDLT
jgi:hypothetical protein